MIVHRVEGQYIECTICGETVELARKEYRNPEALMIRRQEMEAEHAPCVEWRSNPERARAERTYKHNMEIEMRAAMVKATALARAAAGTTARTTARATARATSTVNVTASARAAMRSLPLRGVQAQDDGLESVLRMTA